MSDKPGSLEPLLDLTKKDGEPGDVAKPGAAPYDPTKDREEVRGSIAYLLIWLLIGVICIMMVSIFSKAVLIGDLDKLTATILTPVIGLVGTVLGFYFGEKSK